MYNHISESYISKYINVGNLLALRHDHLHFLHGVPYDFGNRGTTAENNSSLDPLVYFSVELLLQNVVKV